MRLPRITVTVVLAEAVPPAPLHVIVYVVVLVGLTLWGPDVAVDTVQLAEHDVALVDDHVKVDDWPAVIKAGVAFNVTVGGGGGGVTVTVVLAEAVPPAPLHVIVYVVVLVGLTLWEPEVAVAVVQPAPEHDVALVDDHVKIDDCPAAILAGAAFNVTVSGGGVPKTLSSAALVQGWPLISETATRRT
jgi:hypothetical protein